MKNLKDNPPDLIEQTLAVGFIAFMAVAVMPTLATTISSSSPNGLDSTTIRLIGGVFAALVACVIYLRLQKKG